MKYAFLIFILMQINLIALGVNLIIEGNMLMGLFAVILNAFSIPFSIKRFKYHK